MKTSILYTFAVGMALLLFGLVSSSPADILYVANSGDFTIKKFDGAGAGSTFFVGSGVGGSGPNGPQGPLGVAFDSAGNLYIANSGLNTIQKITQSGSGSLFASTGLSSPSGLAFDSAGNLYVANFTGNPIRKFSPSGADLGNFVSSGVTSPKGLAFDSAGNLFVSSGSSNIFKIMPDGTKSVFASTGLNQPTGMAFDSNGNLYVANTGSDTIEKFTSTGTGSVFVNLSSNQYHQPYGLAFDGIGNLYVSTFVTDAILEFPSQNGVLSNIDSVFASSTSGLSDPTYLAFTNDSGVPLPLANQVPEPSTWALLGLGIVALLGISRRYEKCRTK